MTWSSNSMVVGVTLFDLSATSPEFLFSYFVLFLRLLILSILHGFSTYLRVCVTHAISIKISWLYLVSLWSY